MQHDAADGGPLIPSNAPDAIVLLVASSPAVKVRSRTARKCTEPHAYHSAARGLAPWSQHHGIRAMIGLATVSDAQAF